MHTKSLLDVVNIEADEEDDFQKLSETSLGDIKWIMTKQSSGPTMM